MNWKVSIRHRWLLPIAAIAVLLSFLLIGVSVYCVFPPDRLSLIPSLEKDHSNIAARGIIAEIQPNFTSYGLGPPHVKPYHVFPAVVVVNMSQILWTSDNINSSLEYWKNPHSLGVQLRDVPLAYDAADFPDLRTGQAIEFSGFYEDITDNVNSFFITISPSINSSYLKIADFPLPASAAPAPHYLSYQYNESRIFLVSSSAKFNSYPQNIDPADPSFPHMHMGDPCVVVTVTLRNDYSVENPPPDGFLTDDSRNHSLIALIVRLYDKNGFVDAWDVTPGYEQQFYRGQRSYGTEAGETETNNLFLKTSNMNIDRYEFSLGYIGKYPIP